MFDPYIIYIIYNTANPTIYTLSLHDALPICGGGCPRSRRHHGSDPHDDDADRVDGRARLARSRAGAGLRVGGLDGIRSEEHTSELQSRLHLVCRLLLEKKKSTSIDGILLLEL